MADSTIQIVFSNPFEGKDDEFNEWYDNVHLPEVLDGDPDEVLAATSKAVHAGEIVMSDTFDARNSRLSFWTARGPKVESQ